MSLINVLNDFPYRPRFYLTRPWKFFQECWWNIKAVWQRATKGHAWRDSAEMDEFLLYIIPSMLRDIANGEAYPGNDEFPTYESWQQFCNQLADKFESAQEEKLYDRNQFNDKFLDAFDVVHGHPNITITHDMSVEEANEILRQHRDREAELYKERDIIIQEAYTTLAKYHNYFWI